MEVFRRYGRDSHGKFSAPARWSDGPADAGALARRLGETGNDLTAAAVALVPDIGDLLAAIENAPGCLLARMSGSGASCFGLFAEATAARRAADELTAKRPLWWIAAAPMLTADCAD